MDYIRDLVFTLLKALQKGDSYEKRIKVARKTLSSSLWVVRLLVSISQQSHVGTRSYYKRIQSGSVKGVWYGKQARHMAESDLASGSGPIVMYIHGGAFNVGQAKMWSSWMVGMIDEHKKKYNKDLRFFSVDYTLASEQHFPCQWNECQAALDYLIRTRGIQPARLFISGDSAGGNLALQTLFEMESAKSLAGALLFSPWTLLAPTLVQAGVAEDQNSILPSKEDSWYTNKDYDYITDKFGQDGALAYVGRSMTYQTAYGSTQINPALRAAEEFAKLPSLLVSYGGSECLKDQIIKFIKTAKQSIDNVEVLEIESGVHDWNLAESTCRTHAEFLKGIEFVSAYIEKRMIHA